MNKISNRLQQALTTLLVVAVIGLLGWLSTQFKVQIDWTANHRNTLTAASVKQLGSMKGPVNVTVFAPTGADSRGDVVQFFSRYSDVKKDFKLEFVDPAKNPTKVREANIQQVADMVLAFGGRKETLHASDLNEAAITQALQRLSFAEERFVVFLEGHGEHALANEGASGYSAFAEALKNNGIKTTSLNLATTPKVPDNASLVVVAGPTTPLLAGEAAILNGYVTGGGNLLWLSDPDTPALPEALGKTLGVTLEKGTAVFPEYAELTGDPALFITSSYPATPVTQNLTENAAFPLIRAIATDASAKPVPAWLTQPFLQSTQQAWVETGPLAGEIGFDPGKGDKPGPLTLGLLLSRDLAPPPAAANGDAPKPAGKPQRAAVVGDSDFLSNAILAQAGNSKLGLNLLRWLSSRDEQLDVTVPQAPDQSLSLSPLAALAAEAAFLALLPLLLVLIGLVRWVRRRRR
jgi:ABC-type uncharacterized transport system involved in gliding motility auxiliary subunit